MTRPSLIKRIENYAKSRPEQWISGLEYGRLAYEAKYKPDTASRRLRELAHPTELLRQHPEKKDCKGCADGILAHREIKGYVEYKWISRREENIYLICPSEVETHQGALV